MEVKLIKCETCLSSDRQLVCLTKIQWLIDELQLTQILAINGGVCWECHCEMMRYCKFKRKVKRAQDIFSSNVEDQQIKSLSNLRNTIKLNYDFEYTHFYDPLIIVNPDETEIDIKYEPELVKQEADETESDERIYCDGGYDKPINTVFAECLKVRNFEQDEKITGKNIISQNQNKKKLKENRLKKKLYVKENNTDNKESLQEELKDEDLKSKFESILFTEEEMLKCREEKRNQANFKKIPFKCDSCVTGFTKKENYELHLMKKHDKSIGAHTCTVCQTRFASITTLTRHQTKHYLQYKCIICDYKVSSHKAATNHGRDKHANDYRDRIHCKQCAFVARTSKELTEHTRADHSFICNECGVKFKGRNTLRAHKTRIHAVKREFSCDICSKTFVNKSRLECHASRHGAAAARRLAYCAPCRTQYKDIHVYRSHLRNSARHAQDRVTCPVCGKRFASRVYFTKHYNFYHLRQSQYKCEACDKIFISEWRLKIHKQTHHGLSRTREHACSVCGKKFYTKATLVTHSQLHAASRGFMCARCGATFRQRAALYTHAKLLHPSL